MKTLLPVDGHALIYRAYHALPEFKTKDGIPTNAVYGFAIMLLKTIEDFKPSHVVVCLDTPEETFRKKLFKEYQKQRPEMEDKLQGQLPFIRDFLDSAAIQSIDKSGYEADDLIGTIAKKVTKGYKVLILTGDRDIIQLVNPKTQVITPKKGITEVRIYGEKESVEKFGVPPDKIPDLKALMGDPSDNYKGVPGIGPKTAANLIQNFGTIENLFQHLNEVKNKKIYDLLVKNKKQAFLSKKLATIVCDVDIDINIDTAKFPGYNENLRAFFEKMEFRSLLKRYFEKDDKQNNTEKKEKRTNNEDQLGLF